MSVTAGITAAVSSETDALVLLTATTVGSTGGSVAFVCVVIVPGADSEKVVERLVDEDTMVLAFVETFEVSDREHGVMNKNCCSAINGTSGAACTSSFKKRGRQPRQRLVHLGASQWFQAGLLSVISSP